MDRIATIADPLYVVGDVNIHLERTGDADARQLTDLLTSYGLVCRVPLPIPTHDRGGVLDVVASREDLPSCPVDVLDVGLSDRLLRWTAPLARPPPVYTTVVRRSWGRLDINVFHAGLLSSQLCRPDVWTTVDVNGLVRLYNTKITALLDRLIPYRFVTYRRRLSDPWLDDDCRAAKHRTRQLNASPVELRRATSLPPLPSGSYNAE